MEGVVLTKASPEHLQEIVDLANLVFRPGVPPDRGMKQLFPLFLSDTNADSLYIAVVDERVVSHIGTYHHRVQTHMGVIAVASMGAVCTHPDYRGRGIATMLLDFVQDCLLEEGVDMLLISGGRGLYRRIGAKDLTCFAKGSICAGSIQDYETRSGCAIGFEALPCQKDVLSQVFDVYMAESLRYERTFDSFKATVNALSLDTGSSLGLGIASLDNKLVAYVMFQFHTRNDRLVGEVKEYAGDRRAVLDVIVKALDRYDLDTAGLCVPKSDATLLDFLARVNIHVFDASLPGHTAKVLTWSSTMKALLADGTDVNSKAGIEVPFPLPGANYI